MFSLRITTSPSSDAEKMTFYCRLHPDFEGLDMGKLHEHIEKEHSDAVKHGKNYKESIAIFFKENIEIADVRRSDGRIIQRTWGRPPKMGQFVTDSEVEKK